MTQQPPHADRTGPTWVSLLAVGVWAALIAAAVLVGRSLLDDGVPILAEAPPLFARWAPHTGPGTGWAIGVAVVVVAGAPWAIRRLSWPALLAVAYLAGLAWTFALAMVSGFEQGIATRLTRNAEYLLEVDEAPGWVELLGEYTERILGGQPDSWVSHVAGHPPGALQFYLALDRMGLSGGAWAGVVTILVGSTAVVAVAVAVRALAGERAARAVVPFSVLTPAAVWMGVSADAVFTAVTAWGVALLALAFRAQRREGTRRADLWALGAGLLLGMGVYLSYGLVLMAPIVLAVALQQRRLRPVLIAAIGVAVVALAYTVAGFQWWEAIGLVRERYLAGYGGQRPYSYWVWANLAALAVMLGPAVAAGLGQSVARGVAAARERRADVTQPVGMVGTPREAVGATRADAIGSQSDSVTERSDSVAEPVDAGTDRPSGAVEKPRGADTAAGADVQASGLLALPTGAAVSVLLATLSGMSKAEVERIWLPFGVWLTTACALLPLRQMRWWLGAQAATALAVEHLLEIRW